ncbi:IS481 family transposase [Corynebacterium sp. CNCTC7651]|uniref:IS481 family transposase n=1 Tax=Corynebacterium sp. CNCTC7651 TaxID=2815361 RepID=UPI001F175D35|nr:IS481 family transposase [Corynebacterium sp. CNCTC7651]UIZ92270.1 IS481 family transposase [Corynebacterium sp. CNCTC7651]UIZ92334.1 IS481 family transposase [Corynebacterium sp. CNCTC7651]
MNSPNRNLAIVKAVRDQGEPVAKVAARFGISRQRVYQILYKYDAGGPEAIAPKTRAPHTHPQAVPKTLRNHIIDMRKELVKSGLDAGPDTIAFHLEQQGMRVPSTSTIRRILTDAGLVTPQPKKKPRSAYIRFEAAMPNECWQADITHLYLIDGTRIEVLDFLDDHSRYLLSITAKHAFTGTAVAAELERLITIYGPPASTLTDNGLVFTARLAGAKGGRNAFEKTLNHHRIQQKNGRPGHPQTQGKIERFHQTLKKWIAAKPPAETLPQLQRYLDEFADYYNTTRPHRALGRKTPEQAYTTGPKAEPNDNPKEEWRIRNDIVTPGGKVTVRYAGKLYQLGISRKYAGEPVLMVITDNHITTSLKETGEIITEHYIDTSRNYQKPYWKHGQPPLT